MNMGKQDSLACFTKQSMVIKNSAHSLSELVWFLSINVCQSMAVSDNRANR